MAANRFQDQNKRLSEFQQEVLVACPQCGKKTLAKVNYDQQSAELICLQCGYNKRTSTEISFYGMAGHWRLPAHEYFNAELWLQHPFKDSFFFAYNEAHLDYLETYIGAALREHKDRTHFTLIEKLPKFYHDAKNRDALLKIITKLRKKN